MSTSLSILLLLFLFLFLFLLRDENEVEEPVLLLDEPVRLLGMLTRVERISPRRKSFLENLPALRTLSVSCEAGDRAAKLTSGLTLGLASAKGAIAQLKMKILRRKYIVETAIKLFVLIFR